jgi:hypothetical protein
LAFGEYGYGTVPERESQAMLIFGGVIAQG